MSVHVALDTNVLLSAIFFPSRTLSEVIRIASGPDYRILLADYVVEEARLVIARKWPEHLRDLDTFLAHLPYRSAPTVREAPGTPVAMRDPNDLPVIYSALAGGATILVTGDKDFSDVRVEGLTILTPAEFIRTH